MVNALETANTKRELEPGIVHHSDQGAQYTALSSGKHLERFGMLSSRGRVGSALKNTMAVSFYAILDSLQTALLDWRPWPTSAQRKTAIVDATEIDYDRTRRNTTLYDPSPLDDEATHQTRTSLTTARLPPVHQTR